MRTESCAARALGPGTSYAPFPLSPRRQISATEILDVAAAIGRRVEPAIPLERAGSAPEAGPRAIEPGVRRNDVVDPPSPKFPRFVRRIAF